LIGLAVDERDVYLWGIRKGASAREASKAGTNDDNTTSRRRCHRAHLPRDKEPVTSQASGWL
jgi:hypothetical protein